MMRSRYGIVLSAAGVTLAWASASAAKTAYDTEAGATHSFLKLVTERLEFTLAQVPALGSHLLGLPGQIGGRVALLLVGIVAAGLLAEYLVRLLFSRARLRGFDRLVGQSPL